MRTPKNNSVRKKEESNPITAQSETGQTSVRVGDVTAVVKVTSCVLLTAELGPDGPLSVVMETRTS